jgi:hypothetical protein
LKYLRHYNDINWNELQIVIAVPILSDHNKHRCDNNDISIVYLYDVLNNNEYVISCNHEDFYKNGSDWISLVTWPKKTFCYNKAVFWMRGVKCYDIDMCSWLISNTALNSSYTSSINTYYNWYYNNENINNIIPIVNLIEYCQHIKNDFLDIYNKVEFDNTLEFYNNIVLEGFYSIENNELPINKKLLEDYYKNQSNKLYTQYFPYTITGRPSNRYNGINFAALTKDTGVRSIIQRQHDDELLIEFDYDSHHIRLVSNLIGYDLPESNLHEYFGKQYFNTDELTTDLYNRSKQLSFQMLYGYMIPEYNNIEFFQKVENYRNKLWGQYVKHKMIKTPLTKRCIYSHNHNDLNVTKLFNYIIQGLETDVNSIMINNILKYLKNKKSKLILYTYDSFLFQYNKQDGNEFINDVKKILNNYKLKTNVSVGFDYDNMKKILL